MNKIIFFGMGLDSGNRGVNALCIGATEIVASSYNVKEITLISFRKKTAEPVEYTLKTSVGNVKVVNKFFSKKDLLGALKDVVLFKLFNKEPYSSLSSEIYSGNLIFDLNEGDSFSDIYGLSRILRHFLDSFLAISLKKDLIFLPQTIGPFDTLIGKSLGLYILKRLKKLYVRDDKAVPLLEKYNIDFTQTIDLAVYMSPKEVNINILEGAVAINISGLMYYNNYKSLQGQFRDYKTILLKVVEYFQSINKHIIFIPHTYNVDNILDEDDLSAIKDFVYENSLKDITIVDKSYDAQELKYIISQTDFFIGSRMHACIGALSSSVPTIGLAYSYKFKGTFDMFNSIETAIEVNNIASDEVSKIVKQISNIYKNKEFYKNRLIETNQRELLKL
jgi:colanic acid/amylovoran biosynthesis protein